MSNQVIYKGWPNFRVAPDLSVDMDAESVTFGWLLALHPDGVNWVTVADLKPIAARICGDRK